MSSKGDFWSEATAAARYGAARPYFHPHVMRIIRRRLELAQERKLARGVDVGCGTGQSSVALLEVAESVVGVDNSEQMLAHAEQRAGVEYLYGTAEELPVPDGCADIVTASLTIHWFDLPVFLREVARVLRPGGWLVSYSNGFSGWMAENKGFHAWSRDVYRVRYPAPPHRDYDPAAETFASAGFEICQPEQYQNEVTLSREQLVAYLMTQSNVVAAVEQGNERAEDVSSWLTEQVTPYFESGPSGTFLFWGWVTCARLSD